MNQAEFFKCLADPTRLDIVMMIVKQGERCVCDLTAGLQLSQPKISRHLALLRNGKILQDRRQGQWVHYRLHDELPDWCLDVLTLSAAQHPRFNPADAELCSSLNCCN
ncbi:ArsR/SmtB family transcription factor [Acinetobacter sp.]|uniref:ArsR/SmtB family transcription factor n=1 Tax=Acinetobacter sp. TaxID=472 RepID=UPI002FC89A20